MMTIPQQLRGELAWMQRVNSRGTGVGLYGPSVKRNGPIPHCEELVALGYATRCDHGTVDRRGYWITLAGERALAAEPKRAAR